jgi:hypothetical protein
VTIVSDEVIYTRRSGTLYDVMELILDRGLVIDAFVRISLVGIEIIKIDARIVVASVDTYLRFAEACNRLDLEHDSSRTVPELLGGTGSGAVKKVGKAGAKKALESVGGRAKDVMSALTGDHDDEDDEDDEKERQPASRRRATSAKDDDRPRRRRHTEGE